MITENGIGLDISKVNRSEISRQTGADLAHISRIFNQKGNPSLPLAIKIARVLHVTVETLCDALDIGQESLGADTRADRTNQIDDGQNEPSGQNEEILDNGATPVL